MDHYEERWFGDVLVTYDRAANAVYVYLHEGAEVCSTVPWIEDSVNIDCDHWGQPIGIEVLL